MKRQAAYDVRGVAEMFGISERTVRRLIERGELGCVHVGRSVRVLPVQLEAYVERLRRESDGADGATASGVQVIPMDAATRGARAR